MNCELKFRLKYHSERSEESLASYRQTADTVSNDRHPEPAPAGVRIQLINQLGSSNIGWISRARGARNDRTPESLYFPVILNPEGVKNLLPFAKFTAGKRYFGFQPQYDCLFICEL